MIEKEFPVLKTKDIHTSEFMREELIKTLDEYNIQEVKVFAQVRDIIYTQQYQIFDKITEANCKFLYDNRIILIRYIINYEIPNDRNKEFETLQKCNDLFYEGNESFMSAYKRMCRRDRAFSDYNFQYIYALVRSKNPVQVEKTDQEQTLKITYRIDL